MKIETILCSESAVISRLHDLNNRTFLAIVKNIKRGTFSRSSDSKNYQDRLAYTNELRVFVYNPAVLNIVLSNEEIKTLFLEHLVYGPN